MMKQLRPIIFVLVAAVSLVMSMVFQARALGPKVSEPLNRHNLSASNAIPGFLYKATDDPAGNPRGQQICIFCHTPHSANVVGQAPLWNRKFSIVDNFQRYSSATLQIRGIGAAQYGNNAQPNGSSKLCLSCHDGVSRLGEVYNGPEIPMANANVISGRASFNPSTNKMKIGHHPVSFVYKNNADTTVIDAINLGKSTTSYKMDNALAPRVKLDKQGRMQCATCHDAHQNQSFEDQCYGGTGNCIAPNDRKKVPFWVHGGGADATTDQEAVCKTCHPMSGWTGWPPP